MKILAAIDTSDYADKVLDAAMDQAAAKNAELTVMTVAEQPFSEVYSMDVAGLLRQEHEKALKKAEERAIARGMTITTVIEDATSPSGTIVRWAEDHKVDLIVLGHKGRSAVERFLVGSVAAKVVTHAPCTVLVVQ